MSKGDLEDLAALWREDPDPAEQGELERLARTARRRGRLGDYADLALVLLIVGASVVAIFAARSPLFMAPAVLLIIATVWLTLKRRSIRHMSRMLRTTDRESFLEDSIQSVKGNLRRNLLSLVLFPPIAPLALLLKMGTRTAADPDAIMGALLTWAGSPRGLITTLVLLVLMIFLVRARRRYLAELRHLQELRRAYEDEARRDAQAN